MEKYDFTNKAIKCETWEQMEHLAELAKAQGLKPEMFSRVDFFDSDKKYRHFYAEESVYTNFSQEHLPNFTEVSYSDFTAITP